MYLTNITCRSRDQGNFTAKDCMPRIEIQNMYKKNKLFCRICMVVLTSSQIFFKFVIVNKRGNL